MSDLERNTNIHDFDFVKSTITKDQIYMEFAYYKEVIGKQRTKKLKLINVLAFKWNKFHFPQQIASCVYEKQIQKKDLDRYAKALEIEPSIKLIGQKFVSVEFHIGMDLCAIVEKLEWE